MSEQKVALAHSQKTSSNCSESPFLKFFFFFFLQKPDSRLSHETSIWQSTRNVHLLSFKFFLHDVILVKVHAIAKTECKKDSHDIIINIVIIKISCKVEDTSCAAETSKKVCSSFAWHQKWFSSFNSKKVKCPFQFFPKRCAVCKCSQDFSSVRKKRRMKKQNENWVSVKNLFLSTLIRFFPFII
jgi:hypothetical protein